MRPPIDPTWKTVGERTIDPEHTIDIWRTNVRNLPNNATWQAHWGTKPNMAFDHLLRARICARSLMDRVLANYLHIPPEKIVIQREITGRPFVANTNLDFNLSHSGDWAVMAVAPSGRVGIDVERTRQDRDFRAITTRYFAKSETLALLAIHNPEKASAYFYDLWTAKEAALKAMGTGIANGLEKTIILPSGNIRFCNAEEMNLKHFSIDHGYSAAAAWADTTISDLRFFHCTL